MTERERWIVYPLLFLALGVSLRDKLLDHTRTKVIECQELVVYGEESAGQPAVPLVRVGGMERVSAGSPHLGEIVVFGVESAGLPPVPLVQIGGRKRASSDSSQLGEIAVKGIVSALGVEAEGMQASQINADNYFFRRVPFSPLVRTIPGVSPADQLRAQQLQQQATEAAQNGSQQASAKPAERDAATDEPQTPAKPPVTPTDAAPPAK